MCRSDWAGRAVLCGSRKPRRHSGGGLYAYATEAFGPIVGGIAGTLLWLANSVVANAAVGNLLVDTLAAAFPSSGGGVSRFLILATLYALLAAVNVRGARSGARLSVILAVVKIAPLVLLVIAGSFVARGSNLQWIAMPTAAQVGQTAVLLFFAFMGVEGALNVSGEVTNPARTVPRAIFLSLTLVAVLYIGLQTVAQGVPGERLPGESAPLMALASATLGPWGTRLLFVTTLLAVAGYLSADILGCPRVFSRRWQSGTNCLARLQQCHPQFKTPAVAIGVYALVRGRRMVGDVPSARDRQHIRHADAVSHLLSRGASTSRTKCRERWRAVSCARWTVRSARRIRDHGLAAVDAQLVGVGGRGVSRGRIRRRLCIAGTLAAGTDRIHPPAFTRGASRVRVASCAQPVGMAQHWKAATDATWHSRPCHGRYGLRSRQSVVEWVPALQ